jgi:mono/diheme cytochrome c family protein
MTRVKEALRHPFGRVVLLVVGCYLLFKYGIAYLPPLVGISSAPVPQSVVLEFMAIALAGILIWVSEDEDRWRQFKQPIRSTMLDRDKKPLRVALLVLVPVLVGFLTYQQVRPKVSAPAALRAIHPAPPGQITFRGKTIRLDRLENPLRAAGRIEEARELGKRVYYENCMPCHGDALDGAGHYAHGFNPAPLSFESSGTIAQLTESFVFWRIAKGGPGLPPEGTPWNSAMPAWEDFLTEEEIWAVTIFLYEQTGWSPRTWGEEGHGGGE